MMRGFFYGKRLGLLLYSLLCAVACGARLEAAVPQVDLPLGYECGRSLQMHYVLPGFGVKSTARPNAGEKVIAIIKAANEGDPEAQFQMGVCCVAGFGMKKNELEGAQWFEKSARQGFPGGKYMLGYMLIHSDAIQHNLPAAAGLLREAAEANNLFAQSALGFVYENGLGVEKDQAKAIEWYDKAARAGLAEGQFNLGHCYTHGEGVPKNEEEGTRLYRLAAEQGDLHAQHNLGISYLFGRGAEKNEQEAARLIGKCAEAGLFPSQLAMFYLCENGVGVPKNQPEACKWLEKAANQGSVLAQTVLADKYFDGRGGVARDFAASMKWATLAADHGERHAMGRVACLHYQGKGVPKNDAVAYSWYRKAADQGEPFCQFMVASMLYEGTGTAANKEEAALWARRGVSNGSAEAKIFLDVLNSPASLKYFRQTPEEQERDAIAAAATGDAQKEFELGCLYWNAVRRPRDVAKAHEWVMKAVAQNHPRAIALLPKIERAMSGPPSNVVSDSNLAVSPR